MSTKTFKHSAEVREMKKEASRRCRARQKAIAKGEVITPELAVRTLHSKALNLDNFKMDLGDKTVRLNRNGGTAIAMVIVQQTADGVVRTRKSFKDLMTAVKAFREMITA